MARSAAAAVVALPAMTPAAAVGAVARWNPVDRLGVGPSAGAETDVAVGSDGVAVVVEHIRVGNPAVGPVAEDDLRVLERTPRGTSRSRRLSPAGTRADRPVVAIAPGGGHRAVIAFRIRGRRGDRLGGLFRASPGPLGAERARGPAPPEAPA